MPTESLKETKLLCEPALNWCSPHLFILLLLALTSTATLSQASPRSKHVCRMQVVSGQELHCLKVLFKFILFNIHGYQVLSDNEYHGDDSRFSFILIYWENCNCP